MPMTRHVALFNSVVADCAGPLPPGSRILDFGCGDGKLVGAYVSAGFDCYGADIVLAAETDRLRRIENGRIPFPDGFFDCVVSFEVFEHVMDYDAALSEIRRVTKPGGVGLHVFPPRLSPLEMHTFVPLAGAVQTRAWFMLWAALGIRNQFQRGMSVRQTADTNHRWVKTGTQYLTKREIAAAFRRHCDDVQFAEREWIRRSFTATRHLSPIVEAFPFLAALYGAVAGRIVFTRVTA